MNNKELFLTDAQMLRLKAENQLKDKKGTVEKPVTEIEVKMLLHELQVHQIELEMQNEELRQANEMAETALRKYTMLYDFAPMGYFTLDADGSICDLNFTGAEMLHDKRFADAKEACEVMPGYDNHPLCYVYMVSDIVYLCEDSDYILIFPPFDKPSAMTCQPLPPFPMPPPTPRKPSSGQPIAFISMNLIRTMLLFAFFSPIALFPNSPVNPFSRACDTISNWDGIVQNWEVYAGSSSVVENPLPDSINPSAHCLQIVTTTSPYDLMMYSMGTPADFDHFPKYRIKILAPAGNGTATLKFQNAGNTQWQEIEMTPIPGRWTDLEFDFSGLSYNNLTQMVIFVDFQGTLAGKSWYVDDVIKEIPPPLQLQSNLPIIVINTFGVPVPDEPKISGHMGVIDNGPGNLNNLDDPYNNFDGAIGIETRGTSTQMFPKKSYSVETRDSTGQNLDIPLLGMPDENDWILYAPYTDKSMLRNAVTFDLSRKMGDYHSRTRFCEVVLNDDYKGVYLLMEKIKKDKNRIDIATLNPDEIAGDDLTGGYMLTVDWWKEGMIYGIDGWRSDPVPPYPNAKDITFQFYYPEPGVIVSQQRDYIRGYVTRAENTLTSPGFSNPDEGYMKYLDAASFAEFMLVAELSKEVDKYRYSNYFFKQKDSDGGKLFAGPVWDFNLGYGNVDYWQPGINPSGWVYSSVTSVDWSIMFWWKRLMEDPYFRDLARTRWNGLRQNAWSDASINSVIDSITTLIGDAKDRNYERWPILGTYIWPNYNWQNNDYEDEVAYFRNFLFQRLHWMDNNLPGKELHPWAGISADGNRIRLRVYGDYFAHPMIKASHFRLNDAPAGMTIKDVGYLNASECILVVSQVATGFPGISVTVEKKILNTWQDLTSNKLANAGTGEMLSGTGISVFSGSGAIHIRCDRPETLPGQVEVVNIAGQLVGIFRLEKIPENIVDIHLVPGIYFIKFKTGPNPQIHRLVITR